MIVSELIEELQKIDKPDRPIALVLNEEIFGVDEITILETVDRNLAFLDMVFIELKVIDK